jgi:hypothetical protein
MLPVPMPSLYPPPPPPKKKRDDRVSFTVRLAPAEYAAVQLIAKVWNATDDAMAVKRYRRWKPSSVVARLITIGIEHFFSGVKRPMPRTEEELAQFVEHCVQVLAGSNSGKKK